MGSDELMHGELNYRYRAGVEVGFPNLPVVERKLNRVLLKHSTVPSLCRWYAVAWI